MARAKFVRRTADVRRQALIDAMADCLAERGSDGASVRAVCGRAGVSPGLLAHYFDGIDALMLATYRDVVRRVAVATQAAVEAAGDDPRARLDAYAAAAFRPPVLDPNLLATWVVFWSLVKSNPAMAEMHAETYGEYREDIEQLITCCAPDMPVAQVRLAAIGIAALVDGLWLELCLDASTFTPEDAMRLVERWISDLLDA